MNRILDRYVFRDLAPPLLLSGVLLTFLLIIDRIYHLTDLVVTKGVPFSMVLGLLLFMLPSFLAHTLPMALLVAVLLTAGRLAGDLEVVALKASGVSPLRLFRPFVVAACLATLATGLLTLWLNPLANRAFQRHLVRILQTRAATGISERVFSTTFGQIVVYVEEVSPSHVALGGVLVSDERDPKRSRIITAREGRLLTDEENDRITLRLIDGALNESPAGEPGRYRYSTFELYDMNLAVEAPFKGAPRVEKPEKYLSLRRLLAAAATLRREGQNPAPYEVEVHKRFALPVAALVFTLVGFPLGIRAHTGGRAIAVGGSLAIIVAYYFLLTSLEGIALVRRLPSWAAIWAPNLLFGGVGLVLLRSTIAPPVPLARSALVRRLRAVLVWRLPIGTLRAARIGGPRATSWIIDRYLVREYLTYLGYGLAVGAVLFVIVDIFQTLDRFLRLKPPLHLIVEHLLYRLPAELYKGLPVVILVATIFLFLSLARAHELTALKAAGVSLYRVSRPVLLLAVGVSAASVLFQETLLPMLNAKADEVDRIKIRGEPPRHLQRRNQIWYRSADTRFFRMELLDPAGQAIDGLTLLEIDRDYRLLSRLDARQARWTTAGWEFRDGVVREFSGGDQVQAIPFRLTTLELPERMETFTQIQKPTEMMNFLELRAYLARLQESGHQVGKYIVKLYEKLAFPLIHAVLALVAIPLALASPRSGRLIGIGLAIVIAMAYWFVHSLALSFAKADMLPPLLAAWTANIIFAGLGLSLFLRART
ncbi:MAG: LPS export ABC transporter permease LptG [Candidatus Rokubacteria bacterium]|nr:LPS export ABC transporter permease LptG [Candidatus Rokubacteria bacterium]